MSNCKNILLINFGGIGDEILFLPVIQSIKKTFPQSKITLCLESRSKAFLDLTNSVDDYFFADIKTKNKYIQMFKLYLKALTGKYDVVISSGASPLISILLYLTMIPVRIGYKTSKLSEKLLTHPVILNKNQYAAKMYFDLVYPLTKDEFELPRIEIEDCDKIPSSVLVHPGVSKISVNKGIQKTFDGKKWAEIIKYLAAKGKKVYLVGGPDDEKCISEIRSELNSDENNLYTDMFGKTENIYDLANLIKKSELFVCSDSAPMHIAVAVNTKTLAVFGPTDDEKLLPDSPEFIAIKNDTDCRPCLWEKRQTTCGNLRCLNIPVRIFDKFL